MVLMITSWVKSIIFVVLFASFVELLLPSSSMKRFVRVIMGLFIMLAILSPVIDIVQNRLALNAVPALSMNLDNSNAILSEAKSFVHGREELAIELYKKELAQQMQIMISALEGVADVRVMVDISAKTGATQGKITGVAIYIVPGNNAKNTIKKISIGDENKTLADVNSELKNKVVKIITELYQVPKEMVTVKRLHS